METHRKNLSKTNTPAAPRWSWSVCFLSAVQVFSVEIGSAGEAALESVVAVVSGGIIAAIVSENIALMAGGNGGDWKDSVDKGKGDSEAKPDLDKVNDSYLKKKGIDAHELKKDIYGKKAKVAEYDIYVDKKTGQLYTQRKPQYNKAGEPAIPTGEYIK